jgi:hypothetical protein
MKCQAQTGAVAALSSTVRASHNSDRRNANNELAMLISRIQSAVLILVALAVFVGCRPPPHTYSIYTVTMKYPAGQIVMTLFQEVPNADACTVTVKAADKGIAEANTKAETVGGAAVCVSELPAELQKVASGERLRGAYIVKISAPPVPPHYSISRGFPVDRPDLVCGMLVKRMGERLRDDNAVLTCQFPSEIASVRVGEGGSPKP